MPGYIIHLTEAEMILRQMQESGYEQACQKTWKEQFLFGVLLPDASVKEHKAVTHFWTESNEKKIINVPELDKFLGKYNHMLAHPVVFGYFVHLHLDRCFFSEYMMNRIDFLNEQGEKVELISQIESVKIKQEQKLISAQAFFSEEYLYGDYTKLNAYFIKKFQLNSDIRVSTRDIPIQEADKSQMYSVKEKLKKYVEAGKIQEEKELRVFNVESLEKFLQEKAQTILQLWKKLCENRT